MGDERVQGDKGDAGDARERVKKRERKRARILFVL